MIFPKVLFDNIRIFISLKRLAAFLNAEELDEAAVHKNTDEEVPAIEITNGKFSWEKQKEDSDDDLGFTLDTGDSLHIEKGKLLAIVGKVGCGNEMGACKK